MQKNSYLVTNQMKCALTGCGSSVGSIYASNASSPETDPSIYLFNNMSLVMRKPAFCICENKDADQLRGNHEADQRLCFSLYR